MADKEKENFVAHKNAVKEYEKGPAQSSQIAERATMAAEAHQAPAHKSKSAADDDEEDVQVLKRVSIFGTSTDLL